MIILSKKRITIILSCILVGIFTFMLQSVDITNVKTVPTVTLPVSGKSIVVDARTPEYQMKELKVHKEQQKQKQI